MAVRKSTTRKLGSKKSVSKKKATKKKTSAKKKSATKKKAVVKKKTTVKKKLSAKKKTTAKKKAVVKKKVAVKKKTTAKKKTVVKKKATVKKKTAVKKKSTPKKKAPVKAKSTTKKKVVSPKKVVGAKKPATAKKNKKKKKGSHVVNVVSPRTVFNDVSIKPGTATSSTTLAQMGLKPYELAIDEEYMIESQRDHFRNILLKWKQQLMDEVDRTMTHMKAEEINLPDWTDRASQEEAFNLELRTRDRERKLIKKIEDSLKLLDADEYGFCESCGAEIGVRRLEARPTATLCIDCKTVTEIREKQVGN